MKNIIATLTAISVLFAAARAQSVEKSVHSSAGAFLQTATLSADFTLGESTIAAYTSGGFTLSQGYQHPSSLSASLPENQYPGAGVYPNPVRETFTVSPGLYTGEYYLKVCTAGGNTVLAAGPASGELRLNAGDFETGYYLLVITAADGSLIGVKPLVKTE